MRRWPHGTREGSTNRQPWRDGKRFNCGTYTCNFPIISFYDASGQIIANCAGRDTGGEPVGAVSAIVTMGIKNPIVTMGTKNPNGDGSSISLDPFRVTVSTTPEPASLVLLGTGFVGLLSAARRRRAGLDVSEDAV